MPAPHHRPQGIPHATQPTGVGASEQDAPPSTRPVCPMAIEPTGKRTYRADTGPRPVIRLPPSKCPALPDPVDGEV
ncbi:hypothetical protein N7534_012099 [Penicillium rubens]|nr:hypothetical protein N7534_012099 [Penicillium rubens]